jgi:hypothetical protein
LIWLYHIENGDEEGSRLGTGRLINIPDALD